MLEWRLSRSEFGRLVLISVDGSRHENVVPVRAFPIGSPDKGIALVSVDGHELVWIDRLDGLPDTEKWLISDELASREFMPVIHRITHVSTFATPSTWGVDTDRGTTQFVLKGEEDIRRIGQTSLLIADSHGIHFLIRDLKTLDRASKKILDRFL